MLVADQVASGAGIATRMNLLSRFVRPLLDYRASRWPPQQQVALEVDTLQRRMVAICLRAPRQPGELFGDYHRRRSREAAAQCRRFGTWSARWFQRAIAWDDHLRRARNSSSWPAKLLRYHDAAWLQTFRLMASSASVLAGRTNTRLCPGKVHVRWDNGVHLARRT